jgi:uncharacterized membrane protein YphA (DoxX/SURF4 family)
METRAGGALSVLGSLTIVGTRVFLGLIFFTGGMSKLVPFPGVMGPVWLEQELEQYALALYARFIAWSEMLIGLLLLSQRFATLGAIMLVPLVLNIFMVVTSMGWRGTPYVVLFFMVLNVVLLVHDRDRIKLLFMDRPDAARVIPVRRRSLVADALSVLGLLACSAGAVLHPHDAITGYTAIGGGLALILAGAVWPSRRDAKADPDSSDAPPSAD